MVVLSGSWVSLVPSSSPMSRVVRVLVKRRLLSISVVCDKRLNAEKRNVEDVVDLDGPTRELDKKETAFVRPSARRESASDAERLFEELGDVQVIVSG
jgi:hypothetical protein